MPYFITRKVFLFPSFDLEEKEREKISKFLMLLEKSGVGDVVSKYVKNNTEKGGRPNSNYYNLFATILYGFALIVVSWSISMIKPSLLMSMMLMPY